jgi:hypothetical protein
MEKKGNISEYAKRMRELAGLSEGNQNKSLKTIQEGVNSFEDGATFYAKDMTTPNSKRKKTSGVDLDINGNFTQNTSSSHINENYMSDEMFEKIRVEAINYLNGTSGWVTVLYEPNDSSLVIFKDVSGLDEERDEIELDEVENYMEISVDEALDLVRSGRVTPYIKEEIPSLSEGDDEDYELIGREVEYGINPEIDDEFETHKFEQRSVKGSEDDKELYNLNENTIIILDFLD